MTTPTYEDAVRVLRNRIGARWEGFESDGRDEMERTLRNELGYTAEQSRDAIDAMIRMGTLRYQHSESAVDPDVPPVIPTTGAGMSAGNSAAAPSGATAIPAVALTAAGYWSIGSDTDDEEPGRKGQVKIKY
jgi:hypothetical protein